LAWRGNALQSDDRRRSFELTELIRHLPADIQYVSLQKDVRETDRQTLRSHPQILDVADGLEDFSDTAALIDCLDLVVTVDTSVAHLSGALGRETWVLLSFSPDWRWMLDRDDSPWYAAMRLYRQEKPAGWSDVFERVSSALAEWRSRGR
jgi:ADP-heptose:LPS heptosyltransferase